MKRAPGAPLEPALHGLVRALAACSLLTFWPGASDLRAQVLPTGMNPVAGQVTARTVGNTLTVNNSPNAIINWNTFSIGAGNAVRFEQAGASSQVLNRVTGNDPSAILGYLSSNGRVWLLNPNGVLFGQGARVDVAGLVVSTLNLNNADWLAGNHRFVQGTGKPADIVNQGELRSSLGGQVALIGANVRNEGEIDAPGGQVLVAAGSSVELVDSMTPNVSVKLNAGAGEVVNLGRLMAAGGRIDVQSAIVNQNGIVRADSLSGGPGGEVVMHARDGLNLAAGSQTTANGDSGGKITLQADQTLVRGELAATGSQGAGGQIRLLSRQVGLLDAARVDASGAAGGGEVLVGGGQQGKDPAIPNAQAVYFGPEASIAADALGSGNGGRVILWSDNATRAYGTLSARGGALGGQGGFIETSGGWLDARPLRLDVSAPKGAAGRWLLDPFDVTINDAGPDAGYDPVTFTANANGTTISTGVIAAQLGVGNNVTISTGGSGGGQAGNITMANATLSVGGSIAGSLSLTADGSIAITGSTIESTSAAMNVSLLAARGGDGGITLQNSRITSRNGTITLGGFGAGVGVSGPFNNAAFSTSSVGVTVDNSTVDSGTGNLGANLFINGASGGSFAGVQLSNASVLRGRNITINGSSTGTNGVEIPNASVTSLPGNITVQGTGAQAGVLLDAGSSLLESPATQGSGVLSVSGRSFGTGPGVVVAGDITANNGPSISVSASNTAGVTPALSVTGNITVSSAPGALTLAILNPASVDNDILINGSTLAGTAGGIVITGARTLTLQNTTVTGHNAKLQADNIDFEGATSLISNQPTGDVFILTNRNSGPLTSFINNSTVGTGGSGALQTSGPPARWIIWASDITGNAFQPGSLPYDFTLYGAGDPTTWSTIAGNGYVSSSAGVATVLGTIDPKVYDATQSAVLQGSLQATGPRGEVAVFGTPPGVQFVDKNAGTAKPVELVGSFTVSFADALGKPAFGLTLQSGLAADITPAPLSISGLVANNKVYDATVTATLSGTASVTPLGSDSVAVSPTAGGTFSDKNVGTAKSVSISQLSLIGADAGNYIPIATGLSADITPASLVVTGVSANNKVYDTTATATLSGVATVAALGNDSVTVGGAPLALFSDKNVGTGKNVAVSGFTLSGTDAGNYSVVQPSELTADITPASLLVTGVSANSKVYDTTATATLSGAAAVAALGNDAVTVGGAPLALFSDKNVGTGKNVAVSGFILSGTDAGNYSVVQPSGLTADITPASLSVFGLVANNKVYDATVAATLSGTASVSPLGNDLVAVSPTAVGTFSDKNVGTAKSVSISQLSLIGADAGNYIHIATGLSANITPASLLVTGVSANNKVYDATATATLGGAAAVAALGSDAVTVSGAPLALFSDKNVGTGKNVAVSGFTLSGTDAGNYSVVQPSGLSADITPAPLSVLGLVASNKVYDATATARLSGTASVTPLGSDSVAVSTTAVGTFSDKNVGTAKSVSISQLGLTGADAGNYVPIATGLTADITPAPLSVFGLVANNKVYDATVAATLSGTASVSPLGNDLVAVSPTAVGTFSDKNVGTGKNVSISQLSLIGADAGNYVPIATGLSANITPASLLVTGVSANNKVYDATATATLGGAAAVAALGSDAVTVSGAPLALFSDKNVGTGKNVAVSGFTLSGTDAGNYSVVQPSGLSADITPAPLRYVAAPVTQFVGQTLPSLTGSVEGFVGGETLQSATTGTLGFSTPATSASPPGRYAVLGGGLSANNYIFMQDAANDTALTLNPPATADATLTSKFVDAAPTQALQLMTRPVQPPDPALGGVVDLVPHIPSIDTRRTASASASTSFEPVSVSDMSKEALVDMLDARAQYKKMLFADALEQLQKDPALADMPPCRSREELRDGGCVLTPALKRVMQSTPAPASVAIAPQTTAAPAAPAATPPASVSTPTAPAAPPSVPAAVPPGSAAAATPLPHLLAGPRRVLSASLPQIHRKVALVIGVDRYDDPTIPKLANAVGDAVAIGKVLESQMGYETVVLENATKKSVVTALNDLAVELGEKDSVIIYYAGHGELVESTKLGYWLLADSDAKRPETWLSNADIGRMVAQVEASQVALVSDSCYSGSLVTDQRIRAAVGAVDPAQVLSRRSVVVMSSGGNEPVADAGKQGHSPFAWNLMTNLRQLSAWQPGGTLFERVRFAVAKELPQRPQYGAFGAGGHQAGGDYLFEQRKLEPGFQ